MNTFNHDRNVKTMEKQRLGEDPSYNETEETWEGQDAIPDSVKADQNTCSGCGDPLSTAGECENTQCPECPDYDDEDLDDEDEDDEDYDDEEDDE